MPSSIEKPENSDILAAIEAELDAIEARDDPADRPLVIQLLAQAQLEATATGVIDCRPVTRDRVSLPQAALDQWFEANKLVRRAAGFLAGRWRVAAARPA